MAAPALQKTWQGGSTSGGTQFVNVVVPGVVPKETLFAIKQAKIGFFSNPWTVVGSSDGVGASLDGTDRWIDSGDILTWSPGNPRSWIVLQQAAIGATFQCLLYNLDTTADFDGNDIGVIYNEGGFGTANGGTDGDASTLPTPSDTAKNFSPPSTDWCGAEGGAPTQKVLTCISSTDGECTRFLISQQSTGLPINMWGIEVPRFPPTEWTVPAVTYMFKSTVASGLSCLRWETMQASGANMQAHMGAQGGGTFTAGMVPMGPMFSTVEVVDLQEDDRPNPMLYPVRLWGGTYAETILNHGSLFDWYWCSRNPAGKHLSDTDSIPLSGNRTLVCVGDCVIGWVDNSLTDLHYDFVPHRVRPLDTAAIQTALGIDGTLTTNIAEDSSHLYKLDANPSLDEGTLGVSTAWDLSGGAFAPTITTAPDFWEGALNILDFDTLTDVISTGAGNNRIPSAKDGTKSWVMGGSIIVESLPEADVDAWLYSQYNNSTGDGWYVSMWNTFGAALKLRFVIYQGGAATQCIATLPVVLGEAFDWIANLDVAASKLKVMTSTPGSYAEIAYVDTGDFDSVAEPLRLGDRIIPGIASSLTKRGLFWSFEYSAAIDAGISEANMTRYKKFLSGNPVP